jgi:phosphoribosylglycinamide formyltransferase-1
MENRALKTGVLMHLVTPELDRGPVVTCCTFPIRGGEFDKYWAEIEKRSISEIRKKEGEKNRLFQLIRQQGLRREFPLIVATITAFSTGKVVITADKRVVDAQGNPISGYDLTDEIEKVVQ